MNRRSALGSRGCSGAAKTTMLCNCGTILLLSALASAANAQEKVIFSFSLDKTGHGSTYNGNLAVRSDGFVYGTATYGGTGARGGGVVFEAKTPAKAYKVLYRFPKSDDIDPSNGLTAGGNGYLYGLNAYGGANDSGFVYQMTPPTLSPTGQWEETILYSFGTNEADGFGGPFNTQPLFDPTTGSLYGTTLDGGPSAQGTLFRLDPPAKTGGEWTETVLYAFTGGSDGGEPMGAITGNPDGGIIYGTAQVGGSAGFGNGVVWGYNTSTNTMTTVYTFQGGNDGAFPQGGVIGPFPYGGGSPDYYLLGATMNGGSSLNEGFGEGTVFAINLPSSSKQPATDTILHVFEGPDGDYPISGLSWIGGAAWGTTPSGGNGWTMASGGGNGVLFKVAVTGSTLSYVPVYQFKGHPDGSNPWTGLVGDSSGNVYGMTLSGGSNNVGTLFEFVP